MELPMFLRAFLPSGGLAIAADFSALLVFVGISMAIGFVVGRWKLINILINAYIALAFVGVIPSEWFGLIPYARAVVFIALVVFLTFVDARLFDVHITSAGTDFFWRLFVMSILVVGMLTSILLSFLPPAAVRGFADGLFLTIFASEYALFFWMVAPLLVLFFINRRLR
jgi:hypothetical protein